MQGAIDALQAEIDALPSGSFVTTTGGGGEGFHDYGNLGATPTLDLDDGNGLAGTLNANATVAFTGFDAAVMDSVLVRITEDGSGGHTLAWTGVTWPGSTPTHDDTPGSVELYVFVSTDGGTTIYGAQVGSGVDGRHLRHPGADLRHHQRRGIDRRGHRPRRAAGHLRCHGAGHPSLRGQRRHRLRHRRLAAGITSTP